MSDQLVVDMITEDRTSEKRSTVTRRRMLIGAMGVLGISGIGVLGFSNSANATVVPGEITAEGDEITSHDGSIDKIEVEPSATIYWEGFNSSNTPVEAFEIDFEVEEEGLSQSISAGDITVEGTNGEKNVEFDTHNLLDDEEWDASLFEAADNDSTNTTEITVNYRLEFEDEDKSTSEEGTLTITVHNHPANAEISGEIQTTIVSDEAIET